MILFGKKIKEMRQKHGVTQEKLAEHLEISPQAVSKWERDEGYPDITLLPRIAMFFETTTDELLGLGQEKMLAEIEALIEQDKKLRFKGDIKAVHLLWNEAYKKYPRNLTIIENYAQVLWDLFILGNTQDKSLAEKVIDLFKYLLDNSTNTSQRDHALQIIAYTYSEMGDDENAIKYANMGTSLYSTKTSLLQHVLKGEEKIVHIQGMMVELTENLASCAKTLSWIDNDYNAEDKIKITKYALNLYNLLYDNDESGFFYTRISELASQLAQLYAYRKDRDNTLKYLFDAVKYAKIYDNFILSFETTDHYQYKSLMLNKYIGDSTISKNYTGNECSKVLRSTKCSNYDFIRNDPQFINIKKELEQNSI